jgi:hypothetical protein
MREGPMLTTVNDPVTALADYWCRADVMHEHLWELRTKIGDDLEIIRGDGHLWMLFTTYTSFWLSSLYVVAEGFLELKLVDGIIESLVREHIDDLRLFRNGTFHFQTSPHKTAQFFSGGQINWAEELHEEFCEFFQAYFAELGLTAA